MFHSCPTISTSLHDGTFPIVVCNMSGLNILHKNRRNFSNCLNHFFRSCKTFFHNKKNYFNPDSYFDSYPTENKILQTLIHKDNIEHYFFLSFFFKCLRVEIECHHHLPLGPSLGVFLVPWAAQKVLELVEPLPPPHLPRHLSSFWQM